MSNLTTATHKDLDEIIVRLIAIATAAENVTHLPAVFLVADTMVNIKTGETKAVDVTQEFVNETFNELIDALKVVNLAALRSAIIHTQEGGKYERTVL